MVVLPPSVFSNVPVFRKYKMRYYRKTLKLDVQGQPERDNIGNPIYTKQPVDITVLAKSNSALSSGPRYQQRVGTDDKSWSLKCRMVDPPLVPSELRTGKVVELVIDGQLGDFEFREGMFSPITVIDEKLGQAFYGTWRPKDGES